MRVAYIHKILILASFNYSLGGHKDPMHNCDGYVSMLTLNTVDNGVKWYIKIDDNVHGGLGL